MIAALALITLMPIMNAHAAGYLNIGGQATQGSWIYYTAERYVTDPAAFGADVAFKKYSGPAGLQMGTWKCPGYGGGGTGEYAMATNYWRTVAPDGYFSGTSGRFCLYTNSSSGSGSFNGDLNWD